MPYPFNKPRVDRTGQQFRHLTVLRLATTEERKDKPRTGCWWICKCDCGVTKMISGNCLQMGTTVSCGCYSQKLLAKGWQAQRDRKGTDMEVYWKRAKRSAIKRGYIFDLSVEDAIQLLSMQGNTCALTRWPITIEGVRKDKATASLDRIDSTKGYTKDNTQWVHKDLNWMKQSFAQDYFIKACTAVAHNATNTDKQTTRSWPNDS